MFTPEKITLLASAEAQDFIRKNVNADVQRIVLTNSPIPGLEGRDLAQQIASRKKALNKLPEWANIEGIIFPETQAMEQCSSEETADYKQQFFSKSDTVADLTGGYGIDSFAISKMVKTLSYVERQGYLCMLARHNFKVAGVNNIEVSHDELENYLNQWKKDPSDWVYCDPARRDEHQRKVFLLEDCSPDLQELAPIVLGAGSSLLAKLSPMLDITRIVEVFGSSLKAVHVISVKNECKELLLELTPGNHETRLVCVNLESEQPGFECTYRQMKSASASLSDPAKYLYEANASIMKVQASDCLASQMHLNKLEAHSYLYTSDELVPDFPGRIFTIEQVISPDKKTLSLVIPSKKANISTRNFPMKPEEIHKKMGFGTGGEYYVFATTLKSGKKVLICCKKFTSI